jgi:prepilin-type N-terminal cleavage/methylation domain-containing protein
MKPISNFHPSISLRVKFPISNFKRGFTLIELLVSMGIFLTVITLAVGSVVSTQRFQGRANLERQLQQLGRDVIEKISTEVKNANGWVDENNLLCKNSDGTLMAPIEALGNQLIIRRHNEYGGNYLVKFQTTGSSGNYKLQIGSISGVGCTFNTSNINFQDLVGPAGNADYKITSENIFFLTGSFASDSKQQPRATGTIPFKVTFGSTELTFQISYSVTSRFYNFKYAY